MYTEQGLNTSSNMSNNNSHWTHQKSMTLRLRCPMACEKQQSNSCERKFALRKASMSHWIVVNGRDGSLS